MFLGHELASFHQLTCSAKRRHTAAPRSRAASHYRSHRRSSNAMATLARASQLHNHELDVRFCSPRESPLVAAYVICANTVDAFLSFFFAATLNKMSTGNSSKPTAGALAADALSHHHAFCTLKAWRSRKAFGSHIGASLSRQLLVTGKRLVRLNTSAATHLTETIDCSLAAVSKNA